MSDLKIFTDNIEPTALNQIYTLAVSGRNGSRRTRFDFSITA
nr:MAG TPA: hypothetical protein [Caudoviricetes sp.]